MKIVSVLENKKLEKRIAITPEIAKKYIASGFEVILIYEHYNKNIAIRTNTAITATVPHNTNLVKLFQVFLWFSLSIKITFVLL